MNVPKMALWLALLAATFVLVASVAGLVLKSTYARETAAYAFQGEGQDIENMAAAFSLLVTSYLVLRGSFRAYLIWLGVLLALMYSYAIYAFAVHFNDLFLVYVAILGLAFYALVVSLVGLRWERLRPILASSGIARTVSVFLLLVALFFAFQWLSEDVPALLSGTVPPSVSDAGLLTNPVHVLDLAFVLPAMVVTAALLWRRQPLGVLLAVPLLVFSVFTVVGILAIFVVTSLHGQPTSLAVEGVFPVLVLISLTLTVLAVRDVHISS